MDTDKTRTTYTPKGTPIGRVRGLGAGHHGTHDWLLMRYTSVASLLLGAFLLVSLALMPDMTFGTVSEWLSRPVPAAAMALLVVSVFWHARLGLQVMIDDLVRRRGAGRGRRRCRRRLVVAHAAAPSPMRTRHSRPNAAPAKAARLSVRIAAKRRPE